MKRVCVIGVYADLDLDEDDIWPDGDAPENWTADDVAKLMADETSSAHEFFRVWNIDPRVSVFDGHTTAYVRFRL